MTFIGLSEGTKGYIFIRSPNNIVFTAIQALFDETLFSKCPNMRRLGFTPVGITPDDLQGEHNMPLDNENGENGGGLPLIPQGGQVPWQHMQPPQLPLQPPRQQPPQSSYYGYPPLPPSPSNSQRSRLSYVDPLDPVPAPTPVPSPPPIPTGPTKYLDDEETAHLNEQIRQLDRQWAHFQQGGLLYLPGEAGYKESKVIPQEWRDATDNAHLNKLRQEIG